jgi:hypothetical protein
MNAYLMLGIIVVVQTLLATLMGYLDTRATLFATSGDTVRFALHPLIIAWHLLCPLIGWLCYRELVQRTGIWNAVMILTVVIGIGELVGIGVAAREAPSRTQAIALVLITIITIWSVCSE